MRGTAYGNWFCIIKSTNETTSEPAVSDTVCLQGLNGICLFFLRTTTKAITPQNIAQEVNFGTMDCTGGKILAGFEKTLSKIFLPSLKSLEVGN